MSEGEDLSARDELPLWSAPFGLALLEAVTLRLARLGQRLERVAAERGELRLEVPFACLDCRAR